MIITITLNPAIDKTIEVDDLQMGMLNKVENVILDPGGKGINVSKVVESLGGRSIATGFLGGSSGHYIEKTLNALEIENTFIHIKEETRTNLKLFNRLTRETTEINEPGPHVSESDVNALIERVVSLIKLPCIVVLSGSAPHGIGAGIYEVLVDICKEKGAMVFLDAYGEGLMEGIKAHPDFIKPNRKEAEHFCGFKIESDLDLVNAGKKFLEAGVKNVFITLGDEGALFCNHEKALRLHPLRVNAHSRVGAGDAFVGGFLYAVEQGSDIDESLRLAVATSAGAVMTIGTKPMNMEWIMGQIDRVVLELI